MASLFATGPVHVFLGLPAVSPLGFLLARRFDALANVGVAAGNVVRGVQNVFGVNAPEAAAGAAATAQFNSEKAAALRAVAQVPQYLGTCQSSPEAAVYPRYRDL